MKGLLAAYALFSVGAGVMLFYLPLHLFSLGGSMLEVALLTTIPAIVSMLFSGVWGKLSDELKTRKLFMILGMVAMSVFFLSMLVLKTKFLLLLSLAIFTVLTCAAEPAIQAYVTSLLPKEEGAAAGKVNAYNYAGIAAAALFGGFLYDRLGFPSLATLSALAAAAATFIVLVGFKEKIMIVAPPSGHTPTITESKTTTGFWRVIMRLFPVYLFVFLFIVAMSAFSPISSVYLVQLGNSKTTYGAFTFLSFVVGGLVSQKLGRMTDRHGRKTMLLGGGLTYAAVFIFLYFVKAPLLALMAWSFPVYMLGWIAAMAAVAEGTSTANKGTGMGLLTSSKNLGMVAGSFIGGVIATTSVSTVLAFSAIVSAVGALLVLFTFKRA